jgi:hypothetical protein
MTRLFKRSKFVIMVEQTCLFVGSIILKITSFNAKLLNNVWRKLYFIIFFLYMTLTPWSVL